MLAGLKLTAFTGTVDILGVQRTVELDPDGHIKDTDGNYQPCLVLSIKGAGLDLVEAERILAALRSGLFTKTDPEYDGDDKPSAVAAAGFAEVKKGVTEKAPVVTKPASKEKPEKPKPASAPTVVAPKPVADDLDDEVIADTGDLDMELLATHDKLRGAIEYLATAGHDTPAKVVQLVRDFPVLVGHVPAFRALEEKSGKADFHKRLERSATIALQGTES